MAIVVTYSVESLPCNSTVRVRFPAGSRIFSFFFPGTGCMSFVFCPLLSLVMVLTLCWPQIQGGPPLCMRLILWSIIFALLQAYDARAFGGCKLYSGEVNTRQRNKKKKEKEIKKEKNGFVNRSLTCNIFKSSSLQHVSKTYHCNVVFPPSAPRDQKHKRVYRVIQSIKLDMKWVHSTHYLKNYEHMNTNSTIFVSRLNLIALVSPWLQKCVLQLATQINWHAIWRSKMKLMRVG